MSWAKVELERYVDLISGPAFKSEKFTESEEDIPLVKGDNISPGCIDWKKSKYWPRNNVEKYSQYWLNEGDVILAMDRPWVTAGLKFSWIKPNDPKSLLVQRVARMRGKNGLLTGYLRYIVGSKNFSDYIKNLMGGTNVPHISGKQIKAYEILLPPEPTQAEIVKHLATYDDLIENNKRRIQLLEDSARQLYKEWFVRFRFPGHEHVRIIDGVPEEWKKGEVSQFYRTSSGGTPSRKIPEFYTGEINWVKTQELNNCFIFDTEEKITEEAISKSSAKLHPENSVLVAMYGATIGELGILAKPSTTNQACCALIANADTAHYTHAYLFLKENKTALIGMSKGAAQNNISQDIIKNMDMLMPPQMLLEQFVDIVDPMFLQIKTLSLQIEKLTSARDILLPKLMSGEIAV